MYRFRQGVQVHTMYVFPTQRYLFTGIDKKVLAQNNYTGIR